MKDDAIVLVEAAEIMRSLPTAMQQDDQIMDSVITSLQQGISKHAARLDALEIAQLKTQEAMTKGFQLVNTELQGIKHEAEKDRIHASYAQKEAQSAKAIAERAWERTQSLAIDIARTEQKAEGAKDLAKNSRWMNFDPITGMIICAALMILGMVGMARFEVRTEPSKPSQTSQKDDRPICGIHVACDVRPIDQPAPTRKTEPQQTPFRGGV